MASITGAVAGGNWTSGASWVGGVAPTATDDALLTSASGNITVNSGAVCRSLNCATYTGTLTHTSAVALTIGDGTAGLANVALNLVSGMTYTLGNSSSSSISFASTSGTQQTITTGGKVTGNLLFAGAGSSYQLTDTLTATNGTIALQAGTFDTNNQTVSCLIMNRSTSGTVVLTLGSSSITCTSGGGAFNLGTATDNNLTVNAGTSTVTLSGSSAGFNGANKNYYNVIYSGTNIATIRAVLAFNNVTRTGTANKTDVLEIYNAFTISGTFAVNGNSATNRILVRVQPGSMNGTIAVTSAANSFSNVDFQDITGAGAASWNLSAITGGSGDCAGNSGITFTSAATQYWASGTGNWSDSSKWGTTSGGSGGRVPLSQDTVVFDANSFTAGSQTVTVDMPRIGKDVAFTGVTNTPTAAFSSTTNTLYGSLTFVSGMTISGTQDIRFEGRGTHTVTSAGKTFPGNLAFWDPGATVTFQDALTLSSTKSLTIGGGAINANNFNVTTGTVVQGFTVNLTRSFTLGTGTLTLSGTGTVWDASINSGGYTVSMASGTILISDTSSSTKTFNSGGKTYGAATVAGSGSGSVTFSGAGSYGVVTLNAPKTVIFASSTTHTITGFVANGSSGNLITITSSTSGTAATLSKSSGVVSCDFLSLKDSTVTGGAAWFAGINSTVVSNVTGWVLTSPIGIKANMGMFA